MEYSINTPPFQEIMNGVIPWNAEGYQKAMAEFDRLKKLPLDELEKNYPTGLIPRPSLEDAQVLLYLQNAYGYHDGSSHFERIIRIVEFKENHKQALSKAKTKWTKDINFDDTLLSILCSSVYTERVDMKNSAYGYNEVEAYTFDVDIILNTLFSDN